MAGRSETKKLWVKGTIIFAPPLAILLILWYFSGYNFIIGSLVASYIGGLIVFFLGKFTEIEMEGK